MVTSADWLRAAVVGGHADSGVTDVMEFPGRLDNDEVLGLTDIDLDVARQGLQAGLPPPVDPPGQLTVRPLSLDVAKATETGGFDLFGLIDDDAEWRLDIGGGPSFVRFRNDSVDDGDFFRFNQPPSSQQLPLGGRLHLGASGTEDDPGRRSDDKLATIDLDVELNSPVKDLLVSSTVEGWREFGIIESPLDARYTVSWEIDYDEAQAGPALPPPVVPGGSQPPLGQLEARLVGLRMGRAGEDGDGPLDIVGTVRAATPDEAEWVLDITATASALEFTAVDFGFGPVSIPTLNVESDSFTFDDNVHSGVLDRRLPSGDRSRGVFDSEVQDEVVLTGQFPLGTQLSLRASGIEEDPLFAADPDDELPESNVVLTLNSEMENLRVITVAQGGVDDNPVFDDPGDFGYALIWEIDFLFA